MASISSRARELQEQVPGVARGGLRAVVHALREIADGSRREGAIGSVVVGAFELDAKLVEVVPMAGGEEVAGDIDQAQREVAGAAGLALNQPVGLDHALPQLRGAGGERPGLDGNDLHGRASCTRTAL